jgi:hypothetical protein
LVKKGKERGFVTHFQFNCHSLSSIKELDFVKDILKGDSGKRSNESVAKDAIKKKEEPSDNMSLTLLSRL